MKRSTTVSLLFSFFCFVFLAFARDIPAAAKYQDGTYLGIARRGPFQVKVRVTIDEGEIAGIEFMELPEWKTGEVQGVMRRRIIEDQSTEVDGVSGATLSSDLVKEAVGDALKTARSPRPVSTPASPTPALPPPPPPQAVLETTQGQIVIALYPVQAPRTVENFLGLVKKGYYNGTVFHRVIRNFMVQGGDPSATGRGGESIWGKPFEDEFSPGLTFDRVGVLAMANAGPNTNGSQFFITVGKTPWLNRHHTIFGEVVSGFSAIEAISRVPTGPGDRPLEEQKIIRAYEKK